MAITLYVGGKSVYSKEEKPSDKYVLDPTFESAALASESQQSHLVEFLKEREKEDAAKKSRRAQAKRKQASVGS